MRSSITTARCLSLFVLLLSLAPLASIYMLLSVLRNDIITRGGAASSSSSLLDATTNTINKAETVRDAATELFNDILKEHEKSGIGIASAMSNNVTEAFSTVLSSIEELMWMVLYDQVVPPTKSSPQQNEERVSGATTMALSENDIVEILEIQKNQHLPNIISILVPWAISIFMALLLPCLNIWFGPPGHGNSSYPGQRRRQRQQQRREGGWFGTMSKKRWKQRIEKALQLYTKQLTEDDRIVLVEVVGATKKVKNTEENRDDDSDVDKTGNKTGDNNFDDQSSRPPDNGLVEGWMIPMAGTPLRQKDAQQLHPNIYTNDGVSDPHILAMENHWHPQSKRPVTEQCAICLSNYGCAETIVWSSNPNCIHNFHYGCILTWLLKRRNQETLPCPCCRRAFISENEYEDTK